jgi:hypothetical protein
MINIRKEIINPHTLYLTKVILYRTRTEKGLEAYEIIKRLVYVAYRMCGHKGFITYDSFLKFALTWLDRPETIYEFMSLGDRLKQPFLGGKIFSLDANIVVNGTYGQIERQILDNNS